MEQQPTTTIITRNPVHKVNKAFYLWSYIGGIIAVLILSLIVFIPIIFMGMSKGSSNMWGAIASVIGIAIVLIAAIVYVVVIYCVLTYKAWQGIQDGHARTTPGKAVGFQFIPFFNLYWVFQAYWGYAKDYNAYLTRHNLTSKKLSEGLFLTNCILTVASVLPYLNSLTSLGVMVLDGIIISELCDGINNLAENKT